MPRRTPPSRPRASAPVPPRARRVGPVARAAGLAAALAVALAACGEATRPNTGLDSDGGTPCVGPADCKRGERCLDNVCVVPPGSADGGAPGADAGDAGAGLPADGGTPALVADPAMLDFGFVALGATVEVPVRLTNAGDAPETLVNLLVAAPDARAELVLVPAFTLPAELGPGASATFTARYTPRDAGEDTGTVLVASRHEAVLNIPYRSRVKGTPELAVVADPDAAFAALRAGEALTELDALAFGDVRVGAAAVARTAHLVNAGDGNALLTVRSVHLDPPAGAFWSVAVVPVAPRPEAPVALTPLTERNDAAPSALAVTVTLTPASGCFVPATLLVVTDPDAPPRRVTLSGRTLAAAEEDADGDGAADNCDPCPFDVEDDVDGDGLCARADNCPGVANPGQEDHNGDGVGDACDGCGEMGRFVGTACGTCDSGLWACGDAGAVRCEGDRGAAARNACGGCAVLAQTVGARCGTCDSGTWVCDGAEALRCDDDLGAAARNACGGCAVLASGPGDVCGGCGRDGAFACDGVNAVRCEDPTPGNACGGCAVLAGAPGGACGPCALDTLRCAASGEALECDGETGQNACGGCAPLAGAAGDACGACQLDRLVCREGQLQCDGDTPCPPMACRLRGPQQGLITFAMSPCIVEADANVPAGQTLTVEPGVVFKFVVGRAWGDDDRDFFVDGTLVAEGTAERPIVFTSLRDDTAAGDTNEDGVATAPATGDWGRVEQRGNGVLRLAHAELRWGGGADNGACCAGNKAGTATLIASGALAPELPDVRVAYSQSRGVYVNVTGGFAWALSRVTAVDNAGRGIEVVNGRAPLSLSELSAARNGGDGLVVDTDGPLTATALDVQHNGGDGALLDVQGALELSGSTVAHHPGNTNLVISAAAPGSVVRDCTFEASDSVVPGELEVVASVVPDVVHEVADRNTLVAPDRGLHVRGGALGVDASWTRTDLAYVLDGDVTVTAGHALDVGAGVVVKAAARSAWGDDDVDLLVDGELRARASGLDAIVFTSARDDADGFDVGGDGVASVPAPGDWGRILYRGAARGALENVTVRFGGGGDNGACCAGDKASDAAVSVAATRTPSLIDVRVERSRTRGAHLATSGAFAWTLTRGTFRDNVGAGLLVEAGAAPATLDALVVTGNGAEGLVLSATGAATVIGATVSRNGAAGAVFTVGGDLTLTGSTLERHDADVALRVAAARSTSVVSGNTLRRNALVAEVVPELVDDLVDLNTLEDTTRGLHVRGGVIDLDMRWSAPGFPYVVLADVVVLAGVELELAAGAILKFPPARGWTDDDRDLVVQGRLTAVGTAPAPIVFTSYADDTAGGDTNGDGVGGAPARGDWGRVRFEGSAAGELVFAELRWGGGGDNASCCAGDKAADGMLSVGSMAAPTLSDLSLTDSRSAGARLDATGGLETRLLRAAVARTTGAGIESRAGAGALVVEDSTVASAGAAGVSIDRVGDVRLTRVVSTGAGTSGLSVLSDRVVTLGDCEARGSAGDGLVVTRAGAGSSVSGTTLAGNGHAATVTPTFLGTLVDPGRGNTLSDTARGLAVTGGTLGASATWGAYATPAAYVLQGDLTIPAGVTLTVAPGVVLKAPARRAWGDNDVDVLVAGTLVADGTAEAPIFLTSLVDDAHGGDTNGDGVATSPAPGDLGRLRVEAGGSATLRHFVLACAGGGDNEACCAGNKATDAALSLAGSATLDAVTVLDSRADGVHISGGSGTLDRSDFSGNAGYGLRIDTSPAGLCDAWPRTDVTLARNGAGNAVQGCP